MGGPVFFDGLLCHGVLFHLDVRLAVPDPQLAELSDNIPRTGEGCYWFIRPLTEQQDQDDQGDRDPDEPEQNGHELFLSF
jgi:hypothetical protein